MNLLPRTISLTSKLKLLMMAVSTIAVVIAGLAALSLSYLNYRANLTSDLQNLTLLVGRNFQAALRFNLPKEAEKLLATFNDRPSILFAGIFDADGKPFAAYDPSGKYAAQASHAWNDPGTHAETHAGQLHVVAPVMINRDKIGTLYIIDDMSRMMAAMYEAIIILLGVVLLSTGIAYFLTTRFQGLITGPVLSLSRIAGRITQEKDYSLRAEKRSGDETGLLIDSFNELIASVQQHESERQSAYATVHAREQELEATNEQLLAQEQQLRSTNRELRDANRELVESREKMLRLATAIEQAEEGISLSDVQGRYTYANPAYKSITGHAPAELIGHTPTLLRSPAQDDSTLKDIARTTLQGDTWKGNVKIKRKDGVTIDIEMSTSPIKNTAGEIESYVSIIRDVSREHQMELQMQQTQKMEAIGTLAGGIAHDFNNILSAIIGFTEIAYYNDTATEAIRNHLGNVLKASDRARDLVRQILTFSRMGKQEKKPVLMKPIVKEGLKLLRASIPATIDIRSFLESDAAIMADPTQLHQIIMNLCTNAAHAMEERGGVLEVSLQDFSIRAEAVGGTTDLQPGDYIRLIVGDTGTGIDPAIQDKIFEPFFTTKEQGKGTGMGLSVVHGIVKSHGGAVTVLSEPGEGSTFRVYLPVIARDEFVQGQEHEVLTGGTERILFVDDESMLAAIGRGYLETLGYTVEAFVSSAEALQAFSGNPGGYDLVITDYTMPLMTGYDLAREMLLLRPEMPVILCTGFSETISAHMAKSAGIRELLFKPLNKSALAQIVRRTLDSAQT